MNKGPLLRAFFFVLYPTAAFESRYLRETSSRTAHDLHLPLHPLLRRRAADGPDARAEHDLPDLALAVPGPRRRRHVVVRGGAGLHGAHVLGGAGPHGPLHGGAAGLRDPEDRRRRLPALAGLAGAAPRRA